MTQPLGEQIARIVSMLEAEVAAGPADVNLQTRRQRHEQQTLRFTPPASRAAVGSVSELTVAGPAGSIPVRIYRPDAPGVTIHPTMVWVHGGGWVTGSLQTADVMAREICSMGVVVVTLDYRLAPEAPFPAGLEDCRAVLQWAATNVVDVLGGDAAQLGVGGDSAGGNLAAALAHDGPGLGVDLAMQLLLYPVLDLDIGSRSFPSRLENRDGPLLTIHELTWLIGQYLPTTTDPHHPQISPLHRPDLDSAPPTVVVTAELDPLRDEGDAYARALASAGVPVRQHHVDGMPHCIFDMLEALPEVRKSIHGVLLDVVALFDGRKPDGSASREAGQDGPSPTTR